MQSEWERCRKDLDKARHDVERLRRALERSDAEKRDQQQKAAAARQALQVPCLHCTALLLKMQIWSRLRKGSCHFANNAPEGEAFKTAMRSETQNFCVVVQGQKLS